MRAVKYHTDHTCAFPAMKKTKIRLPLYLVLSGCCWTACTHSRKFDTPVEQVFRLDSTTIGISTVISGLNVPWEIAWGPDNQIWFTEQSGTVSKVDPHTGKRKTLLTIPGIYRQRTLGLLGMAVSPDKQKPYVVVDYTCKRKDSVIVSRLVRYTYTAATDTLTNPLVLLEVPGSTGHNGSRVAISPEGKVIWSTGDAARSSNAQDTASPNGKTLRLNLDGSVPEDNPLPGNPFWSRGHRNIQGLVFTPDGILFSSEHGDATDDEINHIQKGGNYGWPNVEGFCDRPDEKEYCRDTPIVEPLKAWTPTIAPSGIDYYHSGTIPEWNNALLLATLKTASLRVLQLDQEKRRILSEKIYFSKEFGRLRDICISPEGDIYIATSNRDWNPGPGFPKPQDDRILRISRISKRDDLSRVDPQKAIPLPAATVKATASDGVSVYNSYCASCHKPNGKGVKGSFPPLLGSPVVTGDIAPLLQTVLSGKSTPNGKTGNRYDEQMPAFGFLDDRQLAGVLSYIRSAWGNNAGAVAPAEVKAARKNSLNPSIK
ncbi:PQQ-dependent sugar dehydrogenase [Compostibacter hankyongensis]|uniref:Cytochrome c domain-containing protein n=1 Tax=Compostibacter hankyongensis TaxID=1007089 RepID=A0ABP8GA77_9BACT